jgi:hypothetical protein
MNNLEPFLFYRSLSHASRRDPAEFGKTIFSPRDIVESIPYNINEHGYRSIKFSKKNEVLVLGCSQTYGAGMYDEFTWPEIFSNSINKKYSRLAIPGDSIGAQVYKAFKYFEENGNPEIVVGAFPLLRLEYVSVPEKLLPHTQSGHTETERMAVGIANFYIDYFLKFSKAPHLVETVIPKEFVIFYNFMFLKMLEQYCESHKIKFIWTIYDYHDDIQTIPYPALKNYLKTSHCIQEVIANDIKNEKCCKEFNDHKLYRWAADCDPKKSKGHWGIHLHKHISELFIERYKQIQND